MTRKENLKICLIFSHSEVGQNPLNAANCQLGRTSTPRASKTCLGLTMDSGITVANKKQLGSDWEDTPYWICQMKGQQRCVSEPPCYKTRSEDGKDKKTQTWSSLLHLTALQALLHVHDWYLSGVGLSQQSIQQHLCLPPCTCQEHHLTVTTQNVSRCCQIISGWQLLQQITQFLLKPWTHT